MNRRAKVRILSAALLCMACLSVAVWASFFRKTEFNREVWDRGPGWGRWRMRKDVVLKIENEWIFADQISMNLGRPTSMLNGSDLPSMYQLLPSGRVRLFESMEIYISFDDWKRAEQASVISRN